MHYSIGKGKSACLTVGALLLAALLPGSAFGATYYVSPAGNDSNLGSEALPWRTIQKAADTLVAGDTIYIKAGTYAERVVPLNSGSAGNYIVYAAYPGHTVTLDGATLTLPEWTGLFELTLRSYIRVSGLRVLNAGPTLHNTGILADTSSHIVIENNYVSNTTDSGIGVWTSTDVTVDGNEVEDVCTGGYNECISVGGTDGFVVKNNLVHHSTKEGICTKDGSSNGQVFGNEVHHNVRVGFYIDAQAKHTFNIEAFGNVAHDMTQNGFAIASEVGGLLENIRVYNNVAYNNGWTGLQVSACCIADHPMSGIQIVNNTFYNNGKPPWGGGIYLENPQAQGVVIRNNIVSQNLTFQLVVDAGVPLGYYGADYNLIDGFRGDPSEIYGTSSVVGDPQFVNPAAANFHLQASSIAIDHGSAVGAPADDFDGLLRPQQAGYDIGAYEFASSQGDPCVPGDTVLCLGGGDRFEVRATYETPLGQTGSAHVVELTADTGYLWFFDASNVETVVKVLDGCAINNRRWFFAGGLTNVKVTTTVRDATTGETMTYVNPLNQPFQPIQDTTALQGCP